MKSLQAGKLAVKIYDSRAEMGAAAAADVAACMRKLLETKETINMIFAAAPSQNEVLAALKADKTIEWNRVNAFHMDEYVGLPKGAPQRFSEFLKNALFDHVPLRSVNLIDGSEGAQAECARYSALLEKYPTDIVVMGIGENGHIAFNDPPVADFHDPLRMKPVKLDDVCRMQQVHDGCFPTFDDVPEMALTLTVTQLASAAYRFCVVPAPTKAEAVRRTVNDPIGEACPATVMRAGRHDDVSRPGQRCASVRWQPWRSGGFSEFAMAFLYLDNRSCENGGGANAGKPR